MPSPSPRPQELLENVPTRRMQRRLFRCVPLLAYERGDPPSFLYTSGRPNRCNPSGVNCLYFSADKRTAETEYHLAWRGTPAEHQPKITFAARVNFRRILDLEHPRARRILRLENEDLFGTWRSKPAPTRLQVLGGAISRQRKIVALRYPSAAAKKLGKTGWNVAIFPSTLEAANSLEILGESAVPLEALP